PQYQNSEQLSQPVSYIKCHPQSGTLRNHQPRISRIVVESAFPILVIILLWNIPVGHSKNPLLLLPNPNDRNHGRCNKKEEQNNSQYSYPGISARKIFRQPEQNQADRKNGRRNGKIDRPPTHKDSMAGAVDIGILGIR